MAVIGAGSTPAYHPSMIFIDYDAIVDHKDLKYDEENRYFERIQENNDYVDRVKSIKDLTGKRIVGAYFQENVSKRLAKSFDGSITRSKDRLGPYIITTKSE